MDTMEYLARLSVIRTKVSEVLEEISELQRDLHNEDA